MRAAIELWEPRDLRRFGPNTMLRLDSDIRFLSLQEATLCGGEKGGSMEYIVDGVVGEGEEK